MHSSSYFAHFRDLLMFAKKSYGQHFLRHDSIAARIAQSLQMADSVGQVVEVGPGRGILTKQLLAQSAYKTWCVEADRDMVDYLKEHLPQLEDRLLFQDFLEWNPAQTFGDSPFCLIGNFPYNISTQILFKLLDYRHQIPEMAGMFQKEVADRVVSRPGTKVYGITSVLLQASYEARSLFTVEPGSFQPPPKVQSAVIHLTRKAQYVPACDEVRFRKIVKAAFNQRRKMLRNTLRPFFQANTLMEDPFFERRPETLSWQEYVALTNRSE